MSNIVIVSLKQSILDLLESAIVNRSILTPTKRYLGRVSLAHIDRTRSAFIYQLTN
jgi:hypothetical protein